MGMYTAIVIVTVAMLAVTVIDINSSRMLDEKVKRNSTLTCLMTALALLFEWSGVMTDGADTALIPLHMVLKCTEFCVAPLIGVFAAESYGRVRRPRLIACLAVVHIAFEIFGTLTGLVISIDGENIYHRGILYPIYIVTFSLSIIFCIVETLKVDLQQYSRLSLVLVATLLFLILGLVIQIAYSSVRVDYLCIAISHYFLLNHRRKVMFQRDGLTQLLNRRCYETDIQKLSAQALILLFDVNNFKKLNDTYGHSTGDRYLCEVAELIRSVYWKHGCCYRFGGDEFSVIIKKNTGAISGLNTLFQKKIAEKQRLDPVFPGVSIGYSRYDGDASHIKAAIEEADRMMYEEKNQHRAG